MRKKGRSILLVFFLSLVFSLTAMAADGKITMNACLIQGNDVVITAFGTPVQSDDGNYYLFSLKTYEPSVGNRTDYCAVQPVSDVVTFSVPLGQGTVDSKLYSRFVVTALRGGVFVPVSNEMYITNPEVLATASTVSLNEAAGKKKGLHCQIEYMSEVSALQAGYVPITTNLGDLVGGAGITYNYNGRAYQFSRDWIASLDIYVNAITAQGAETTLIILNPYRDNALQMIYPDARMKTNAANYAVNVSEQVPEEMLEAVISFIANRYNGGQYGSVHRYIIGNEVNSSSSACYAGELSVEQFTKRYTDAFRVFYNAIKSQNAGAQVYTSIDQCWVTGAPGTTFYSGRDFLDLFNAQISSEGNIDWGLTFHPYSVPLTHTAFWTGTPAGYPKNLVRHADDTYYVTPMNLEVVTNHMAQNNFLSPSGAVRNIIVSEIGFSSKNASGVINEHDQARAYAYSYQLMNSNPYIKAFYYSAIIDSLYEEQTGGLLFGLKHYNGSPKEAYTIFNQMDLGVDLSAYIP